MGRIQRIEEIVNSTINTYGHTKIFPRGLPRFADQLLRGTIRFGKRTGNNISVINPDNTFDFATAPKIQDETITLTRATEWATVGGIVSMGPGRELHKIEDVVDETIILEKELKRDYTLNEQVLIHSFPMLSSIDTPSGATSILVKSHHQLANGDVLGYLQEGDLLQSYTEVRIAKATRLGTTTDLFFSLLYHLELDDPIERELVSNSEIFLRCYPAYFSAAVRVPNALFTSDPLGPFLIDLLSGKLLEGNEFRETLGVRTINRTGGYVLGDSTSFVTVPKNTVILDRTINAHAPMFWELGEGSMKITPSRVVFQVNEKFQFVVGLKCVPHLPTDKSYSISLISNEDCSIRFYFNPHPFQEFNLISGISQTVTVTIPAGDEVTDIEINVLSTSDACQVQASDWTPLQDTVEEVQYTFVIEAEGDATYQSTGLIVKPYFLGSEFLKATYDVGDLYDGGKVYF